MQRAFLIFVFCLSVQSLFGQIKGKVLNDADGVPFPRANILIKNPLDSTIIAFGITDDKGNFHIKVENFKDSLLLEAKSMLFQPVTRTLYNIDTFIEIKVKSEVVDLDEFTVKGIKNPISIKKDTISYDVSGFTTASDRVIGDIINRLPGLDVSANGTISYEGRPIQKFYIEGLDLLEGRYNLANTTLPVNSVESIELLENHQPIRVLDSLVFSNRASLNIKLKKKNVWTGTGNLGIGASPLLWDVEFSPMYFSPSFQSLNSFQTNNTGEDLDNLTAVLTIDDLKNGGFSSPELTSWVEVHKILSGIIPTKRFYFNQSHLATVNSLKRIKTGSDLRMNIGYLFQELDSRGEANSNYFLPQGDTVSFQEEKINQLGIHKLRGDFTWNKNLSNTYFKNKLSFQILKNQDLSETIFNGSPRSQNADIPLSSISNSFHMIKPFFGILAEVNSELSYKTTDQFLNISPSLFQEENNNDESVEVTQKVFFNRLFTNNAVGAKFKLNKRLTFSPTFGFKFLYDDFESNAFQFDSVLEGFMNSSSYSKINPYILQSVNFKNENLSIQLSIPVQSLNITIDDKISNESDNIRRVFIEPYLQGRYQISGKLSINASVRKNNDFGSLYENYNGNVLRDFRTLYLLNSSLPEMIGVNYLTGFSFKDPVSSWFVSGRISLSQNSAITIRDSFIFPTGELLVSALDLDNESSTTMIGSQVSKYFSEIYSTFSLNLIRQNREMPRLINSELTELQSKSSIIDFKYSFKPKSNLGVSYNLWYNQIRNGFSNQTFNRIDFANQNLTLEYFPTNQHIFTLDISENYSANLSQSTRILTQFVDFSYRWKPEFTKIEFSLFAENLLNKKFFDTYISSFNFESVQRIYLRPRQVIIRAYFTL